MIIKLADFGFAKIDRGDLVTPQFTPYYVSPQVNCTFLINCINLYLKITFTWHINTCMWDISLQTLSLPMHQQFFEKVH